MLRMARDCMQFDGGGHDSFKAQQHLLRRRGRTSCTSERQSDVKHAFSGALLRKVASARVEQVIERDHPNYRALFVAIHNRHSRIPCFCHSIDNSRQRFVGKRQNRVGARKIGQPSQFARVRGQVLARDHSAHPAVSFDNRIEVLPARGMAVLHHTPCLGNRAGTLECDQSGAHHFANENNF